MLDLTNSAVGVGQLANFRYGVDPLPPPPASTYSALPAGSFGRINDPNASDPYVQSCRSASSTTCARSWSLVERLRPHAGRNEPRVQVINPRFESICDSAYPGSTPGDLARAQRRREQPVLRRARSSNAGMPANRLEQINMFGTTNSSKFDSLTTTVPRPRGGRLLSISYVLADSRSWGGQPAASYSGNGIAIAPDHAVRRRRVGGRRASTSGTGFVASAVLDRGAGSRWRRSSSTRRSRPYSPDTGFDINGDGLANIVDRLCEGVEPGATCSRCAATSRRSGAEPERLRAASASTLSGRASSSIPTAPSRSAAAGTSTWTCGSPSRSRRRPEGDRGVYADFYNLFNTENLSFTLRPEQSSARRRRARSCRPVAAGRGSGRRSAGRSRRASESE